MHVVGKMETMNYSFSFCGEVNDYRAREIPSKILDDDPQVLTILSRYVELAKLCVFFKQLYWILESESYYVE